MHEHTLNQIRSEDLLSDEISELISKQPKWLVRRGNVVFLSILLLIVGASFIVSYPDIIKGSALIVSKNIPVHVRSKMEGRLENIFISNDSIVSAGATIAHIQSDVSYEEATKLKAQIDHSIAILANGSLPGKTISFNFSRLGTLQPLYQQLLIELSELDQFTHGGYYTIKAKKIYTDIALIEQQRKLELSKKQLLETDEAIQRNELSAYEKLAKEKVIAPLELNQYKSRLIAKGQGLLQTDNEIASTEMASLNKRRELVDLSKMKADQKHRLLKSLFELKSAINSWEELNVIKAPRGGRLIYMSAIHKNQLINTQQDLFVILPLSTDYYAQLVVGENGFGKISQGQEVIIKSESFPFEEYGYLTGHIQHIAPIASARDSFIVNVTLRDGLRTNTGRQLKFHEKLKASAEIITGKRKLSDRVLGQLAQLWLSR